MRVSVFILTACSMLGIHSSAAEETTSMNVFSLTLGATRLIYYPESTGASLLVTNPQNYPILVQPRMLNADKKTTAPFVVTPPLFRLDGLQENKLRVVYTGAAPASDRETLYWLCVSALPPRKDTAANPLVTQTAKINTQVHLESCIKTMIRPANLSGSSHDAPEKVSWKYNGSHLTAKNPTPYYINLKEASVNGVKVDDIDYIEPFSSRDFTAPIKEVKDVQWRVITDYGGAGKLLISSVNK